MVKSYLALYSFEKLGPGAFVVNSGYCFSTQSAAQEHLAANGVQAPIVEVDLDEKYSTNKLVFNLLVVLTDRSPIEGLQQNRSDVMHGHLTSSPFYNVNNPATLTITEADSATPNPHEIITRETTGWCKLDKKFVSLSSNPAKREALIFSPAELELQRLAELLLAELKIKAFAHVYEILNFLARFIDDKVTKDNNKAEEIIANWQGQTILIEGKVVPVIPLTVFLNAEAFICRHIAILAAFLAQYLIESGLLPQGTVNLTRYTIVEDGLNVGHAVITYSDTRHKWFIDPTGVLTRKDASTGFPYLCVVNHNLPVVANQSASPLASPTRPSPLCRAGAFYLPSTSPGKRFQPEQATPELTPQQTPLVPSSSISDLGNDTEPPPSTSESDISEPSPTRRLRLGT